MAKKKKESFFERLVKKNAAQENQTKAPKKKSWKIAVFGGLLTAAIATGITVPLVVTSLNKKEIPALDGTVSVGTFKTLDGKDLPILINDFKDKNKSWDEMSKNPDKHLELVFKLATSYLYDLESKGSFEYQRFYNASRKGDEDEKRENIALKSIEELQEKYKKQIDDQKRNLKLQDGYDHWEEKFKSYLSTNFGGAKNEKEAIAYQVEKSIKTDALRSFRLVNYSLKNIYKRKAQHTIYEIDSKGNPTNVVLFNKGDLVYPWFEKNKNYFETSDGETMSFMTDSFIMKTIKQSGKTIKTFDDKYKSASKFIEEYLKNNDPIITSQFTLPGVVKAQKNNKWTINEEMLKKLIYIWPFKDASSNAKFSYEMVKEGFQDFDKFVEWSNSSNLEERKKALYWTTVLSKLSLDPSEVKNNWGTKGISTYLSLLNGSDDDVTTMLPLIGYGDNILGTHEKGFIDDKAPKEIDLFNAFKEIQEDIVKEIKEQFKNSGASTEDISKLNAKLDHNFASASTQIEKQAVASKYNEEILKFFKNKNNENKQGLYAEKLNEIISNRLAKLFEHKGEKDGENFVSSVYKLKDENTYILLTKEGIKLVKYKNIQDFQNQWAIDPSKPLTELEVIMKMIKNDFAKEHEDFVDQEENLEKIRFGILNLINKSLSSQEYVLDKMLNDDDFKKYLKSQTNIYSNKDTSKQTKYTDEDIAKLIDWNNKKMTWTKLEAKTSLTKKIEKFAESTFKANVIDDFKYIDGEYVSTKRNNEPVSKLFYSSVDKWLRLLKG
ncbi:HinT-interacting membrane complex protein P80 [Mycoplasma sp. Mirounga ES2805-ORL]|uniref:HinT-interacting membrane complex protein P80 n=1 Tax=Mycoplasma sp. Mirounga ES2805-ORL TaxID=754514 RepID=UPI00197B3345|nr:hypothetical protein [Mycoplasma sp. Mirounga ES2805-ORL]QSF13538.1 hypothetical protein JXZ90_02585 [Mycoplasma sp. Mirounga ES2805-ORL]